MFLVAGLGNPGEEYALTPHNLGFLTIDRLAERHGIRVTRRDSKALVGRGRNRRAAGDAGQAANVYEPERDSLAPLMEKHAIGLDRLVVVYDELDLDWTAVRIKPKGSAAGHNGIKIVDRLAEDGRVRAGKIGDSSGPSG